MTEMERVTRDCIPLAELAQKWGVAWEYAIVVDVESGSSSVSLCCRTLDDPWEPYAPGPGGSSALMRVILSDAMAKKVITGLEVALDTLGLARELD